jgi:hypothetical protein
MSNSPWSAYGRVPQQQQQQQQASSSDPVAGFLNEAARDREQIEKYLNGIVREYYEIQSGEGGYRKIINDALTPSSRPETIQERLERLADRTRGGRSTPPGSQRASR